MKIVRSHRISYRDPYGVGRRHVMLSSELDAAIQTVSAISKEARMRFRQALGWPGERLAIGGCGIVRAKLSRTDGLWEPDANGVPVIVIPARDRPHWEGATILDLIAYHMPSGLSFRRLGLVDVLGEWNIDLPGVYEWPVELFLNPLDWAKSNGAGVVLLDWKRAFNVLGHLSKIAVPDLRTGQALRKRFIASKPQLPEILLADEAAG